MTKLTITSTPIITTTTIPGTAEWTPDVSVIGNTHNAMAHEIRYVHPPKQIFRRRLWREGIPDKEKDYYKRGTIYIDVPEEKILRALATYNPIYRGNLKTYAEPLLKMIAGDLSCRYGVLYFQAGLAMSLPYVRYKTRRRYRATDKALILMEAWRENFPSFRRFYDCYVTPKGVKQIKAECDLLREGGLPSRISALQDEQNAVLVAQKLVGKRTLDEATSMGSLKRVAGELTANLSAGQVTIYPTGSRTK